MSCLASWIPDVMKSQSKKLECVQKRFLKFLFLIADYNPAFQKAGLDRLDCRHEKVTKITLQELEQEGHILYKLFPAERQPLKNSWHQYPYSIPVVKKARFGLVNILYSISKRF
jgi:hypothetical protein